MINCERIVRKKELLSIVGLSAATVWRLERAGLFPQKLVLGGNSRGYLLSEINNWLATKAAQRGAVISHG